MKEIAMVLALSILSGAEAYAELRVRNEVTTDPLRIIVDKNDLIKGLRPAILGGSLRDGEVECLTNGHGTDSPVLCEDTPRAKMSYATPTVLVFALPKNSDIGSVEVYSAWGDVRAYHCYDLEVSSGLKPDFRFVMKNVRANKLGQEPFNNSNDAIRVSTIVENSTGEPIARDVYQLRFTFWPAGTLQTSGRNMFTPRGQGCSGSALCEIDIRTPTVARRHDADFRP